MNEFGATGEVWTVQVDADTTALQTELRAAATSGGSFRQLADTAFDGIAVKGKGPRRRAALAGAQPFQAGAQSRAEAVRQWFSSLLSGLLSAAGSASPTAASSARYAGAVCQRRRHREPDRVSARVRAHRNRRRARRGGDHAAGARARRPARRAAAGGGGGCNVTFNITTPDADSFRRSEAQVAASGARRRQRGQRNL